MRGAVSDGRPYRDPEVASLSCSFETEANARRSKTLLSEPRVSERLLAFLSILLFPKRNTSTPDGAVRGYNRP